MRHDLSLRDLETRELMDDPAADPRLLERTYERFSAVNALVSAPGALYRRDIRPRAARAAIRILDVGAGGGDLARMVAGRLRRDGLTGEVTALDVDDRAVRWARAHDRGAGVVYRRAFAADLVAEGQRFDVVFSNHVLHHLDSAQFDALLHDTALLAAPGGLAVHRDIARSRLAHAFYAGVTQLFRHTLLRDSFIREDGLISIRRSYTPAELAAVAPPGWEVRGRLPARLELRRE